MTWPRNSLHKIWCISVWKVIRTNKEHWTTKTGKMASNVLPEKDIMEGQSANLYILEGKRYNISNAAEALNILATPVDEVTVEISDKSMEMNRIVERVQILTATHCETIKRESKLREKANALQTQVRRRMTETQTRILEMVCTTICVTLTGMKQSQRLEQRIMKW